MKSIHISTARKMLDSGDPLDMKVWAKDGKVLEFHRAVGLRYDFRRGTRQVKLLDSRQIRTIRDVLIFEINGMEVFI